MAEDLIRYDVLAQEALRGLVAKVLSEVARTGLPGEHHFFITFDTQHPGVRLSSRLRAQYPAEMTVVLQHTFWDLIVTESAFEVGLSFGGVPERVHVPFRAITSFVDPHATFALKFDVAAAAAAAEPTAPPEPAERPSSPSAPAAADAKADVVSLDAFRNRNG
jgi:hypothetical protein